MLTQIMYGRIAIRPYVVVKSCRMPNLKELFLKDMRLDMSIVIVAWLLNLGLS